jgi:hypothetical protein
VVLILWLCTAQVHAQTSRPAWVGRSDENARLLLDLGAQFEPEDASSLGVTTADDRIVDLTPGYEQRWQAANAKVVET